MKNHLIFCFLVLTGVYSSQNLTYTVVANDTKAGFFELNIDPWNVLASQSRLTFSGQTGIKIYKAGIYLNLSGDFHYLDNLAASSDRMYGQSVYQDQKSRNINATLGYLINWNKNGTIKFHLKTGHGTGDKKVDTYAKIKIDYRQYFGIEGGIKAGYSHLTYKGDPNLTAKDFYSNQEIPVDGFFSTYLEYKWLQCGFSFGKIVNSEVNFSGYGRRKANYMTKFYGFLVLALSSKLENIYFTPDNGSSTPLTYQYILNDMVPVSKFGFKAGYEFIPIKKLVGFGAEIGTMPGIKNGGNFYLSTKLSFNLGTAL